MRADRLGEAGTDHKLSREALEGRQSIKEACMLFLWSVYVLRIHSLLFYNMTLASSEEREGRPSALCNYFICFI
jgi:hypothetical protein